MTLSSKQYTAYLTALIISTILLLISGLIFVYSSSSVFALERYGSAHYFFIRHLVGIVLGIIGALICYCIPLRVLHRFSPLLFISSLMLTIMTLIPGLSRTIHGSSRWIVIHGFSFQPSDIIKITLILYIARLLEKKSTLPFSFKKSLLPCIIILGITSGILLLQPDFGLAVTLTITTFLLLFIMGTPLQYIGYACGIALPTLGILIAAFPYRLRRILIFLNPWKDPKGSGFQIIQSLIAIGSGGWLGCGIGQSKQKFFYLPMQHTDFIFSIISEETGFLGASIIVLLYCIFLYCGFKLAFIVHNLYARFIILGFSLLITLQALINIFVTTGLFPTKGIGLPLISYGNSALICSLCMIGLIANAYDTKS